MKVSHELFFKDTYGKDKTKWSTRRNLTMALLVRASVKRRSDGFLLFSAVTRVCTLSAF